MTAIIVIKQCEIQLTQTADGCEGSVRFCCVITELRALQLFTAVDHAEHQTDSR